MVFSFSNLLLWLTNVGIFRFIIANSRRQSKPMTTNYWSVFFSSDRIASHVYDRWMKHANSRKSLFWDSFIHGFALAPLAKQLMKSTCSKSMQPVVFQESEFPLHFWITKYRILKKNTLLSVVFCLLCINEEQWFFTSKYLTPFNFHRMNYMEQHERVSERFAIDWRKYLCKMLKSMCRHASFNKLETQHTATYNPPKLILLSVME